MSHDFVGAGWAFPLGVDSRGGIALARRDDELEQAMRLILATYPGERPMRPAFGSRVRDFVFRSATIDTAAELSHEVQTALLRWEPRVDIEYVNVTIDEAERNKFYIDISYRVKGTNDKRNLVFPFYAIPDDGSDY
ncbi:MAG TPA: GPW/gp25 family protein [Jatrophihabitans sp.]|nr:GPW/gp25 family protein [Jatrophihabitans sp.]